MTVSAAPATSMRTTLLSSVSGSENQAEAPEVSRTVDTLTPISGIAPLIVATSPDGFGGVPPRQSGHRQRKPPRSHHLKVAAAASLCSTRMVTGGTVPVPGANRTRRPAASPVPSTAVSTPVIRGAFGASAARSIPSPGSTPPPFPRNRPTDAQGSSRRRCCKYVQRHPPGDNTPPTSCLHCPVRPLRPSSGVLQISLSTGIGQARELPHRRPWRARSWPPPHGG